MVANPYSDLDVLISKIKLEKKLRKPASIKTIDASQKAFKQKLPHKRFKPHDLGPPKGHSKQRTITFTPPTKAPPGYTPPDNIKAKNPNDKLSPLAEESLKSGLNRLGNTKRSWWV